MLVVALALPGIAQTQSASASDERYGQQIAMTCTWFSNFENSRLLECRDSAEKSLLDDYGAAIDCAPNQCESLDSQARVAARWTQLAPVDGMFTVRLLGCVSRDRHLKRYLGDGGRTVLIERVLSVSLKN